MKESRDFNDKGRIIELPGEVLQGKWTASFQPISSEKDQALPRAINPFEFNARLFYRNELRSLPSLSEASTLENLSISTIEVSKDREDSLIELGIAENTDLSCPPMISSIVIAAFDGFDSCSDFLQRRDAVTKKILAGIHQNTQSSMSCKNLTSVVASMDKKQIGTALQCKLAICTRLTIHIAQDSSTGMIVALDGKTICLNLISLFSKEHINQFE